MSVPEAPKMPNSLPNSFFPYNTKLRFFTRMRRLLRSCAAFTKHQKPPEKQKPTIDAQNNMGMAGKKLQGDTHEAVDLQRCVKMLHFGGWDEKEAAAAEIKKLAEQDLKRRKIMAELGVIPPLVAMVGSGAAVRSRLAVRALIELANGTFTALMVEAGILTKLPKSFTDDEPTIQELSQLLLSISSLAANTQLISHIETKQIIPIITSILTSPQTTTTAQESCLATLYNLSSLLHNTGALISSDIFDTLLFFASMKELSEKSLSVLGNLVVAATGRKALEDNPAMPETLIEVMSWDDKPKCQELSAYVLMVLANQSVFQRRKMAEAGLVQVLLEVALMGSPLAQKRAGKMLELFKDERSVRMGHHSGPQMGRVCSVGSPVNRRDVDGGKELMRKIVKQSLCKNMETIVRRANGGGDGSKLKALVVSSSSKSLPY